MYDNHVRSQDEQLLIDGIEADEAGDFAAAERAYKEYIRRNPDRTAGYNDLGTLYFRAGRHGDAASCFRSAAEIDPNDPLSLYNYANALEELGEFGEAIQNYVAAIRNAPNYADPHYNLALGYERDGNLRAALRHWTAYVKLDRNSKWATHARKRVREILESEELHVVHENAKPVLSFAKRPALVLVK
jgi:tetratricopeptide (TPR) repeat protein